VPALRRVAPDRSTVRQDAIAGIPGAIASVPDGMASAVLVGVNPIYGLYASAAGPVAGGLSASTRLMVITTTTAAALAAGSALSGVSSGDRANSLFLLTALAGLVMVAAGLARLGRYTRFVSVSVMTGFLTGVAANIVFGQVPDLTGAPSEGSFALAKAVHVVTHPSSIDVPSLLAGVSALVIMVLLMRTRIAAFASIVALAIPTILVLNVAGIVRVSDSGAIPRGVPLPHVPELSLISFNLVAGAFAVAAIVLVQGAGVSESAPNADGPSNPNRDFAAQGFGNLASALFRGQPVGGSVGQTALNVTSGARSRWGSIFSGIWMVVILVFFSGIVGYVAMPTLAAVLMVAAVSSVRLGAIDTIWRTAVTSRIAFSATLLATLFLSVTEAVAIGIVISLLLQLNREALDLTVVELIPREDGRLEERPAPGHLPSRAVTMLDVYGSLYYAGARTLAARLPDPTGADTPVVIVRLRGRTALGATSFVILADYADRLYEAGGRLYLSGVDPILLDQFRQAQRVDVEGRVRVFVASDVIGDSSGRAYAEAEKWLRTAEKAR
jgi:SulP family sulfate permease